MVHARSRKAKHDIQSWFRNKYRTKDTVDVFCVSTTEYIELTKDRKDRTFAKLPEWTAESTGIRALRRRVIALAKYRGKEEYLTNRHRLVMHLFNEASDACRGFKQMSKRNVLQQFLQDAHQSLPEQCQRHYDNFSTHLQPVLKVFTSLTESWITKGLDQGGVWSKYNANSYWTFLKKNGVHRRPNVKPEQWTRSLLAIAKRDLSLPLNDLVTARYSAFKLELLEVFCDKIDEMKRELRRNLAPSELDAFRNFFDNVQLLKKEFEAVVNAIMQDFGEGIA
jgi:hypothetical protein